MQRPKHDELYDYESPDDFSENDRGIIDYGDSFATLITIAQTGAAVVFQNSVPEPRDDIPSTYFATTNFGSSHDCLTVSYCLA